MVTLFLYLIRSLDCDKLKKINLSYSVVDLFYCFEISHQVTQEYKEKNQNPSIKMMGFIMKEKFNVDAFGAAGPFPEHIWSTLHSSAKRKME